jgi:type II secretory pathway component PulM
MSPREKKLLLFFALAGFLVLNFLALNFYQSKRQEITNDKKDAEIQLEQAHQITANREQVADEMQWLAQHEPAPAANQDVQTQLQQTAETEARNAGLTIKTQKPLPSDTTENRHYHRAKIQITLTGTEQALYQWLDSLNTPDRLRIASQIRLKPFDQDDTKIECTATIEQWFIPAPSA